MPSNQTGASSFEGYTDPTYTPIPDVLFDEQLALLSGAELKVLLYIMRRTFGFKKRSDNISLSQICSGITTREGKVLDHGTGLSKDSVTRAAKSLEEKGLIFRCQRSSAEKGHEATTYSLNLGGRPLSENRTSPSPKNGQALVRKPDTQETVSQETERQNGGVVSHARTQEIRAEQRRPDQPHRPAPRTQENDHIDSANGTTPATGVSAQTAGDHGIPELAVPLHGVAQTLHDSGVSPRVAVELATTYPEAHISAKVEFVQWLLEKHSPLVGKNPAGFLRRAIEEDYSPPRGYRSLAQRQAEEARQQETERVEQERLRQAQEEYHAEKAEQAEQTRRTYPPQPIATTEHTTETAWQEVLTVLREQLSAPNFHTAFASTLLVSCANGQAVIAASSTFQRDRLETRLKPYVTHALSLVVGHPLNCQFVLHTDLTTGGNETPPDSVPHGSAAGASQQFRSPTGGSQSRQRIPGAESSSLDRLTETGQNDAKPPKTAVLLPA